MKTNQRRRERMECSRSFISGGGRSETANIFFEEKARNGKEEMENGRWKKSKPKAKI
jgi:hypothetical protein